MDRGGARGSAPFRSGGGGGGGGGRGGGRRRRGSGGATVKCRGLPYSTSENEVAEFFEDYDVSRVKRDIVQMYRCNLSI